MRLFENVIIVAPRPINIVPLHDSIVYTLPRVCEHVSVTLKLTILNTCYASYHFHCLHETDVLTMTNYTAC
jgi:hypothetical protein